MKEKQTINYFKLLVISIIVLVIICSYSCTPQKELKRVDLSSYSIVWDDDTRITLTNGKDTLKLIYKDGKVCQVETIKTR